MDPDSDKLQYLIREHMIERTASSDDDDNGQTETADVNNGMVNPGEKQVNYLLIVDCTSLSLVDD